MFLLTGTFAKGNGACKGLATAAKVDFFHVIEFG